MTGLRERTWTLQKIVRLVGVLVLITGLVGYAIFQARNFIEGPSIVFFDEETYFPLQKNQTVLLSGKAKNIVRLTVNGKEIHTDAQGVFEHEMILEQGYSIITLEATDRFGRKTATVREYVYVPQDDTAPASDVIIDE